MKVKKNEKQPNPFEVHINNKKFTILGRKSKNDVGKPGISRSKSIQKVRFFFSFCILLLCSKCVFVPYFMFCFFRGRNRY